jgi:hypothetical protein
MKSYKKQTELQRIAGLQNWNLANLKGMKTRLGSINYSNLGIFNSTTIRLVKIQRDIKTLHGLLKEEYAVYRKYKRNERSN